MRRRSVATFFAATMIVACAASPVNASESNENLSFRDVEAQCAPDINIRTMASLIRAESALNPLAININAGHQLARQPQTEQEAVEIAGQLIEQGVNFDVGLAQINSNNFALTGLSLETLFKPCENLKAAAQVLSACYQRSARALGEGQAALRAALSCYNTGSLERGFKNGYVQTVAAQATLPVPELLPWNGKETQPVDENSPVVLHRAGRAASIGSKKPATAGAEGDLFQKNGEPDAFGD